MRAPRRRCASQAIRPTSIERRMTSVTEMPSAFACCSRTSTSSEVKTTVNLTRPGGTDSPGDRDEGHSATATPSLVHRFRHVFAEQFPPRERVGSARHFGLGTLSHSLFGQRARVANAPIHPLLELVGASHGRGVNTKPAAHLPPTHDHGRDPLIIDE